MGCVTGNHDSDFCYYLIEDRGFSSSLSSFVWNFGIMYSILEGFSALGILFYV